MKKKRRNISNSWKSWEQKDHRKPTDEVESTILKDAPKEGVGNLMAGSTTISPHNAFKDPVDTDPSIDVACCSTADATGSYLGNTTAGTDVL